jgi:hypothetical protein
VLISSSLPLSAAPPSRLSGAITCAFLPPSRGTPALAAGVRAFFARVAFFLAGGSCAVACTVAVNVVALFDFAHHQASTMAAAD